MIFKYSYPILIIFQIYQFENIDWGLNRFYNFGFRVKLGVIYHSKKPETGASPSDAVLMFILRDTTIIGLPII